MRRLMTVVLASALLCSAGPARAVVVEVPVTPEYLKENKEAFTINAEVRDDGLVHFKITRRLASGPAYLVTRFTAREEGALVTENLVDTSTASVVREATATFYVAVAPKLLDRARFEVAERTFVESGGEAVPLPGGVDYVIRLADFAPAEGKPDQGAEPPKG